MRFHNRTLSKEINGAIIKANDLFNPESLMMKELLFKNDFKFGSGTGYQVCKKIDLCEIVAPVFFYKPRNPWTKAMGYSDSNGIHLNSRKFQWFSHSALVGLLCHEWLHFGPKFSHGNNYKTKEKCLYSVNYFVSENIEKWL